jgi:NitT/TauT family transport system permease protein
VTLLDAITRSRRGGETRGASTFLASALRPEALGSAAVLVLFLAAWQWGPGLLGVPSYILPTASECWHEFLLMFGRDRLLFHTGVTALEVAVGFGLGALLGMVIGYALGMSSTAEVVLSPYILGLQIAPKVAFAPLFVMWFGFTVYPKILVAVLIVFFPIMVNVLTAIRMVDRDLINLARSFNSTRLQVFWKIEFRAAMPALFSGLRIGSTLAVIGVVVGELVGGNTGLGYLLTYGEGAADTPMVFVSIILLTVIGIIAYLAVILLERRVLHYVPKRARGMEGIS